MWGSKSASVHLMQCIYKNVTAKRAAFMHNVLEKRSTQWKLVVIGKREMLNTDGESRKCEALCHF